MYTVRPMPTEYHAQSRARSPSRRADSISPSLGEARRPHRVDHRRHPGRREQQGQRWPPCDRSAPDPPAARRAGRVQPIRSMQAQAAGTSTNGTVDGSPPRYLAIRPLIVPSSSRPWMIGSKIAFLPLPLPIDRAVLLAGLELGDDLLLAAGLGGLAEVDRRVDHARRRPGRQSSAA